MPGVACRDGRGANLGARRGAAQVSASESRAHEPTAPSLRAPSDPPHRGSVSVSHNSGYVTFRAQATPMPIEKPAGVSPSGWCNLSLTSNQLRTPRTPLPHPPTRTPPRVTWSRRLRPDAPTHPEGSRPAPPTQHSAFYAALVEP